MNADQAVVLAYQHWNTGQAAQAEQLCRRVLQISPKRADAWHLLGLMAHGAGNPSVAINYLSQACMAPGAPAVYYSNLAEMQRQSGQLAAAEAAARQAVARDANLAQGWNNLGIILQEAGKYEESLTALARADALAPDVAETLNNLGNTYARLGRLDQAWGHYTRALALKPSYAEAHSNLASVLHMFGRYDDAMPHVETAIRLKPGLPDAYINAAAIAEARGDYEQALQSLGTLLGLAPAHRRGLLIYAHVLDKLERREEALTICRRAAALQPDDGEVLLTLARILQGDGQPEAALAAIGRAIGLLPEPAEALTAKAMVLLESGDNAAALESAREAVQRQPDLASAWLPYAELKKFSANDPDIKTMEKLLAPSGAQGFIDERGLHFALGKAYLDSGDPARAFAHLHTGNGMKRGEIKFDAGETAAWMAAIAAKFSKPLMERLRGHGVADEAPVFIIGMPRAGTTLIEQILASHPQIHGAGELTALQTLISTFNAGAGPHYPDFAATLDAGMLRRLGTDYLARLPEAPGAKRIADKMPSNFFYAGLIHLALPDARIIHVRRDAGDTCLSCYTKLFSAPQLFAYDLRELGIFHRAYQTLMAHWRGVLPPQNFLEVDYEDVVAGIEQQARRMIDFCGLEWDEACLRFHQTRRTVRTASAAQVRQKLYATSVGRAQRYRDFLTPLFDALEAGPCG